MSVFKIGQFVHYNSREVGWVQKNTFYTYRESAKHFFRLFGGYGISQEVLEWLDYNCIENIVIYVDKKKEFRTSTYKFLRSEIWDYGNDIQRVMSVGQMECTNITEPNQATA